MALKRAAPVNAGDTFLPIRPHNHLYVVCSNPAADPVRVVLINITTFKPKEETCCIVHTGEHPFVKHRSCMRYKDARIAEVKDLLVLCDRSLLFRREPVSPELLARIRKGASDSEYLPEECRRFLQEQSLI